MTTPTDNWREVAAASQAALTEEIVDFIEKCDWYPHPESQLIAVLHMVQDEFGYLGTQHMDAVAQLMGIPAAKVSGVATFYHYFRLQPPGKFTINVCLGTACYVKGADRVLQRLKDELGIDLGETTSDGVFSLAAARCVGTCGLAPVLMVNETVHANVTPDQIPALIERYIAQAHHAEAPAHQ